MGTFSVRVARQVRNHLKLPYFGFDSDFLGNLPRHWAEQHPISQPGQYLFLSSSHPCAVDALVDDDLVGVVAPAELEELGQVEEHGRRQRGRREVPQVLLRHDGRLAQLAQEADAHVALQAAGGRRPAVNSALSKRSSKK